MKIFADLHIHSRFSRACSKQINIENLEKYAKIKGINLLGTGDFQHKKWYEEINKLEEREGILYTKNKFPFLWQTEISLMYTQDKKGRRIHHLILAPNKEVVDQIIEFLASKGRLDYDGRPIFGFSSIELVEAMMSISKDIEIIPAHIWTSYFGLLGSKSGFNSFEECFQEKTKYIHALETGLSSDPKMNWRVSSLDKFSILSFSDSHSFWPWRLGRELTLFNLNPSYKNIINAIRTKENLKGTIEVNPNYGKYHLDGHRNCNVVFSPKETKKHKGICPICKRQLTVGVEYRVEELADRSEGYKPKNPIPFKTLIPLSEILSAVYNAGLATKKVQEESNKIIEKFGSELNVLLEAPEEELNKITNEKVTKTILLNRENKLKIEPGYDGVYGKLILNGKETKKQEFKPIQKSLTEF